MNYEFTVESISYNWTGYISVEYYDRVWTAHVEVPPPKIRGRYIYGPVTVHTNNLETSVMAAYLAACVVGGRITEIRGGTLELLARKRKSKRSR